VIQKRLLIVASCVVGLLARAQITPGFEPGNLSVLRVGDKNTTLAKTGDPLFLDEYTPSGVLTNSIAIPTNGPSSLIVDGTATSEGAISRSANSNFIVIVGYNTDLPYSSSLSGSASTTVPRGVATIDFNGSFSFITNTQTQFSGNNIRGGASDGSNNFWAVGAVSGTVYLGVASPPATVQSAVADSEAISIFNGNLCFSSQKSTPPGIFTFTGLPTTKTATNLMFATGSTSSPYEFAISPDNSVAYVADGRKVSAGGGIQKFVNGGAWRLDYTIPAGATNGVRGVAVDFANPAVIYATTTEASNNRLITITDTGSASAIKVLASAGDTEVFRGVQFSPQGNPPSISSPLQAQVVQQGQSALFSVTAAGSGTLYYLWESNSAPLTTWQTSPSFTVTTTQDPAENFSVTVVVSNSWGISLSTTTLTVTGTNATPPAPVITSQPVSLLLKAGETAVFSVGATGESLSYQWQFDKTSLTDSALITGSTSPTLILSDVFGSSAGSYSVIVTNGGGASNSTPAVLTVTDPWIETQPSGMTYLAGQSIDLSIEAVGTQLVYQWTLNGASVPGATNSALVFSDAAPGNSGSYAVNVSGTYGAVTSATVTVIVASAQTPFAPSNLVVLRVGDEAQTLTNSGNTLFLDQYSTNGAYVSTMGLPDSGPSALIISGVATSEGYMTLSGDGKLLSVAGYNTNPGALTTSLSSSASSEVPRIIGTINGAGQYSAGASTTLQYSADNIRSGATDGSNNFWGAGSADGTFYFGNTSAPATVQSTVVNCRVANVINGNLLFSTQTGTGGIYSFSGLPKTIAAPTELFVTASGSSPEDFAINAAGNLAYVADDGTKSSGGVQRWVPVAGTWTNIYILGSGAKGVGVRSLTVDFSGADPVIYAITAETETNRLIVIQDAGPNSSAVTLATCPPNELFRAVKFAPASAFSPAPQLSAPAWTNGQFSFNLTGIPGSQYAIEFSADLTNWLALQTNAAPFTFVLTNSPGSSAQFFRGVNSP
jgi:hypothetical protein